MAEHKSFLLYKDNRVIVDTCTDEQAGKLIKALYAFACDGEELVTEDKMLFGFFSIIRNSIIRDEEKYQKKCEKNAENGRKGGRSKKKIIVEVVGESVDDADADS